jgi:DNA-binding MarR family transcriptional regulator
MNGKRREDLIAALNTAMRDASGRGVLYSQAVAQRLGINSTDLECLDHIVLRGPLSAGALAEATGLTTGAITGVIDRLERAGFARRERDPEDRRKVSVYADPVVFERIVPLFEPMQRAAVTAVSPYSDEELVLLLDFFTRIREASLGAMTELRDSGPKADRKRRRGGRR